MSAILERISVALTKRVLSPGSAGILARQACASTLPQGASYSMLKFALCRALMAGKDARAPRLTHSQTALEPFSQSSHFQPFAIAAARIAGFSRCFQPESLPQRD